ncbi:hypothetical protein [Coraliomargarita akajimensis]|uniref:Uncharacterized protein n=1 Tax=Coraliomargarita akajimensis (strain DSM 45221 / IAM 15411 / JCM 23193 / KCTC 12865 / 04OKA010-24) TaxID=583355 RepID=D5EIS1_CORAD|nr:hypothetical protein [Coraliomargarita akajimensis]ADE54320.1 hypothetical protein Caka_1300 [Coraliomargarita akajimensis DSM 45221]
MNYTYRILPEYELIVEEVRGEVTIKELAQKTDNLFSDPAYNPMYCGLADYRGAVSRMTKVELYAFADLVNQTNKFGQAKWAVLADDPIVVALSHLFKQRINNAENVSIFSTATAGANFLGKPELLDYVNDEAII